LKGARSKYLAGTLTCGLAGYTPAGVTAYEDADCRLDIGNGTAAADAWSVEVEGTPETIYFKVRLTRDDTSVYYYGKPILVSGLSASSKMGIVLPIEGYTITFDANGGTFAEGTALESVSLPAARTIGEWAFADCMSLESVYLPATPTPIKNIFSYTGSSGTITVFVPAGTGAILVYSSKWGVDASTRLAAIRTDTALTTKQS
jgi:hypothetical protein